MARAGLGPAADDEVDMAASPGGVRASCRLGDEWEEDQAQPGGPLQNTGACLSRPDPRKQYVFSCETTRWTAGVFSAAQREAAAGAAVSERVQLLVFQQAPSKVV